mmetsp:Transcript_5401/g.11910  ORF Transcript_5401/g.11910 Transcript_5401/m.11910 type:complete len:241 (+) Transcript_5401:216-938(+)
MGIKWLLRWRVPKGNQASPADDETIVKVLEDFGVKQMKEKKFEVKCNLLKQAQAPDVASGNRPATAGMKDMWLVQHTDANETCYLLNRPDHLVLEADNGMLRIVETKMDYKVKSIIRLEGKRYMKGDFIIRVAAATQTVMGIGGQQIFLGHVLDVEYVPCASLGLGQALMQEFVNLLSCYIPQAPAPGGTSGQTQPAGRFEIVRPSFEKYPGLPETFGPRHEAVLYAELAVILISAQHQQ